MKNVEEQKKKLQQKKNRLADEETKLKLKERKARTRHLIEHGGLIAKANLAHLPSNALYGALLSLKKQMDNDQIILDSWVTYGDSAFKAEQNLFSQIILTFVTQPEKEIRTQIRSLGLRWNKFRSEWYGAVANLEALKTIIEKQPHNIEILDNN